VLFGGGSLQGTLADMSFIACAAGIAPNRNIGQHHANPTARSSQFFGNYGWVRDGLFDRRRGAFVRVRGCYAWYLFVHHCALRSDKLPYHSLMHHQALIDLQLEITASAKNAVDHYSDDAW